MGPKARANGWVFNLFWKLLMDQCRRSGQGVRCIGRGQSPWKLLYSDGRVLVFSETTLLRIMHILAGTAAKANCQKNRTFVKYSSAMTMHVSSHPVLQNALCLLPLPPLHTWHGQVWHSRNHLWRLHGVKRLQRYGCDKDLMRILNVWSPNLLRCWEGSSKMLHKISPAQKTNAMPVDCQPNGKM